MEPWLSGTLLDLPPVTAALLYSFEHAKQDLRRWTAELTDSQLWRQEADVASVGFHIRHIAGSVDRLITYAQGTELSEEQMTTLKGEAEEKGPGREELLSLLDQKLDHAAQIARSLGSSRFDEVREIGRKRLRVPLGVLLIHIAEHTQRHVGAAIVTAKLARSAKP